MTGAGAPAGWRVSLDPSSRVVDSGRVVIGGTPLRILRLSEAGARLVSRLAAGEAVPAGAGAGALVRRLLDAGMAHPHPPAGTGPGVEDVTVVIPVLDDHEGLARTLAALGPVGAVVVVDDGSADPAAVVAAVARAAADRGAVEPSAVDGAAVDRSVDRAADPAAVDRAADRAAVPRAAVARAAADPAVVAAADRAVDGAAPGPGAAAPRQPVTVLRHDSPRGPAAARNAGWRAAATPVVAFLDADVVPEGGWLPRLLAHLRDPAVDAVAPRVRSVPGGSTPPWLVAYEDRRSSLDLGPTPAPVRPGSRVAYVPTAALVLRRGALDAVEGFDEALPVGEDVDLVWRLAAAGRGVRYEPAVHATHPARPTTAAWLRQRYRYGTAAADLAARHGDAVAPLQISGWSAAAWGLAGLGHPVAGAALAAGTTVALTPKLRNLERPLSEAVRIAGLGNLHAGRAVADALRRPWWPAALALAVLHRRSRPAILAAAVVPPLLERREERTAPGAPAAAPPLGTAAYLAARLADDVAYGAGVLAGCRRRRSTRALRPALTGPFRAAPATPD